MSSEAWPEIDAARVWERHMAMAKIGGTPKGGVRRLALTDLDIEAHLLLAEWAAKRGFEVSIDAIGNMFVRRPGADPSLPPVASGSHTDTQPSGGRFDGIFGVLAAFEALEAIDDAGIRTRHPLEAIVWNNEEGSRFYPGVMGSAVHAGVLPLEKTLATTDRDGVTLAEAVAALRAAFPNAPERPLRSPLTAFIEAHIEQGPELEANGNTIGIVTGMQGNRRFHVEVIGEDAHSGTTPRARRKDAFVAATAMTRALQDVFWGDDPEDVLRFTIGRFEVTPGALTVVPGRVFFTIDFRHPSQETLERLGDRVEEICRSAAGPCEVRVTEVSRERPIDFPPPVIEAIRRSVERRGYRNQPIYSGAGHDARHVAQLCPTAMIFIPCWRGLSHNEAESAEPEDVAAGAQVVADVLVELAGRA